MDQEFRDGRLYLRRSPEERQPLVARLARIEGQVRGIRQMIEDDRYCGDEIHVANAAISAMREVAVMLISQHLAAGIQHASAYPSEQAAFDEMTALLRSAMKI